jgi:CO/xanthine dehydrogenase FAD-binding subunit
MESGSIAEVRIALGSVAPTVLRARATEQMLQGAQLSPALVSAAQQALGREMAPIDDMRSSAAYRRQVAQNLLAEFLEKLSA